MRRVINPENQVFVVLANLDKFDVELQQFSRLPKHVVKEGQMLGDKRKLEFLAGRLLLADLLYEYNGRDTLPAIKTRFNSKPVFIDDDLPNFNISHSVNEIAVAICTNGFIGLDIEARRIKKNSSKIARYFFSQQENDWLQQQNDKIASFWQLWTLRESALKTYGQGVWQMKQISVNPAASTITADFATEFYCHYQYKNNIHLALCCNRPITQIDIRRV